MAIVTSTYPRGVVADTLIKLLPAHVTCICVRAPLVGIGQAVRQAHASTQDPAARVTEPAAAAGAANGSAARDCASTSDDYQESDDEVAHGIYIQLLPSVAGCACSPFVANHLDLDSELQSYDRVSAELFQSLDAPEAFRGMLLFCTARNFEQTGRGRTPAARAYFCSSPPYPCFIITFNDHCFCQRIYPPVHRIHTSRT